MEGIGYLSAYLFLSSFDLQGKYLRKTIFMPIHMLLTYTEKKAWEDHILCLDCVDTHLCGIYHKFHTQGHGSRNNLIIIQENLDGRVQGGKNKCVPFLSIQCVYIPPWFFYAR